eukprot:4824575-Amphidinium_carterae.1
MNPSLFVGLGVPIVCVALVPIPHPIRLAKTNVIVIERSIFNINSSVQHNMCCALHAPDTSDCNGVFAWPQHGTN